MANAQEISRARSHASMAATRLHRDLGTTYDGPVDVLGIARGLGLVLMMQPLDNLLGFYVRGDSTSGIVINSQRPESLQRFTLAHEIGHHVLGHSHSADDEHAVDRFDPDSLPEFSAQAFAGSLLMPLPLVNRALRDLPATQQSHALTPSDAYLFGRQLGVSYQAAVWALHRHHRLSLDDARAFSRKGPLAVKNALRGQEPVDDPRADVWMLDADNNNLSVLCRIGDEIRVQLPEDTRTGFAWLIREPASGGLFDPASTDTELVWSDDHLRVNDQPALDAVTGRLATAAPEPLELVQDEHLGTDGTRLDAAPNDSQPDLLAGWPDPTTSSFPGEGGIRSLTFVPREEGPSQVFLELARPWNPEGTTRAQYRLELRVRPKELAGQGLFAPSAEVWVDEHAVGA